MGRRRGRDGLTPVRDFVRSGKPLRGHRSRGDGSFKEIPAADRGWCVREEVKIVADGHGDSRAAGLAGTLIQHVSAHLRKMAGSMKDG